MARRLQDRKTMPRRKTLLCLILGFGLAYPPPLAAQKLSDFAGAWTLNRQLSQFPSEIGFSADFLAAPGRDGKSPVGRAGRGRGGAGGGTPRIQRESQEDAQRVLLLTDEVRMPFDHLTITETAEAITINLADFMIDPSELEAAGPTVTLEVTSDGPTPHNLTVRNAAGDVLMATDDLSAGET